MRLPLVATVYFCLLLSVIPACAQAHESANGPGERLRPEDAQASIREAMTPVERRHATLDWKTLEPHLPDMNTATPQQLELTADVLRARKFPDEALEYYQGALKRGGKPAILLNKIGIMQMELDLIAPAQLTFKQAVQKYPKDPEGWNNMASIEYLRGQFGSAARDYKKAIKLNKQFASYHSNLAAAYFGDKEYNRARKEYEIAVKLDPHVYEYADGAGWRLQMQSPLERGRYYYEMARIAGSQKNDEKVLYWLGKSMEAGFNILEEMRADHILAAYRKDPRVIALVKDTREMQRDRPASRPDVPLTPLPKEEAKS